MCLFASQSLATMSLDPVTCPISFVYNFWVADGWDSSKSRQFLRKYCISIFSHWNLFEISPSFVHLNLPDSKRISLIIKPTEVSNFLCTGLEFWQADRDLSRRFEFPVYCKWTLLNYSGDSDCIPCFSVCILTKLPGFYRRETYGRGFSCHELLFGHFISKAKRWPQTHYRFLGRAIAKNVFLGIGSTYLLRLSGKEINCAINWGLRKVHHRLESAFS